jgi:pSer/pThr/pTyr-binding forkhead associated (FHA) protein
MPRLVFTLEDGTEIETELDADVINIGRHPESTVVLPSPSVSARHATIKHRGDSYYVQDLATTNGTKLNGVEVEEAKLEDGDRLSFGDVPAIVHLSDGAHKKNTGSELSEKEKEKEKENTGSVRAQASHSTVIYTESPGCAGFIILLAFLVFAFFTGICLRHVKEQGGFLPAILMEKISEKFHSSDSAPVIDQKK